MKEVTAPQTHRTQAVQLLLDYLRQERVDCIFGIPGGPIMPLYAALYDRGDIRPILTKHEGGAAFMADGYARASGKFGVCCTTIGPGATNALTGIAVAYADHVPVLLLTAQSPTHQFGRGAFQESSPAAVDIVELFRPVTKWSTMIPHPDRTADTIQQAIRTMTSGRPGPVHINLPIDFATQRVEAEVVPSARYRSSNRTFDRESVKEGARLLLLARRPAILAGQGANLSRSWHVLRSLAERLSIPVATTLKAKGAFPEDHPLSLGVFGYCGAPRAHDFILSAETDLVLVVGSSLGEVSSCGWDERLAKKVLLQVDIDATQIGRNFPIHVGLPGDATTVLIELLYQVERQLRLHPESEPRPPAPTFPVDLPGLGSLETATASPGALKPQAVLRELRASLARDSIVFVDNGTTRVWATRHFPVYEEGTFFVNMGMASMGYAVAGSIGAKLARPDRTVVALVGDAAFAMNGLEVHTAVEQDLPVIWVVFNNGGHGMIYHGERMQFGGRFVSSVFREPIDVAGIAKALGARVFRVTRPGETADAIREAVACGKPAVLDVATALSETPPIGSRVQALCREAATKGD
ncbi:MAG: thiamine pyrophosphate-binding protein [Elusimicrobia bacterium]|nr:thiamine pyrophosphate-binding protein [Elusimicrobiota bacterium]